jgi:hypothetical protein
MSTDMYTFASAVLLPFSMIHFMMDYLSDDEIKHSETKIGIFQYLHHLFGAATVFAVVVLPFINPKLSVTAFTIIMCLFAQIGWLKNKEFCWYWALMNKMINPDKPKRKWTADIFSLMKKYIRTGENWAYTNVYKVDNTLTVLIMCLSQLFVLIRYHRSR